MQVRMRTHITGYRNGVEWPPVGGIVDVEDHEAKRMFLAGTAEQVPEGTVDTSYADEAEQVPEGTVDEVLEWVGANSARAQLALDAENARSKPRTSLVDPLTELLPAD